MFKLMLLFDILVVKRHLHF